MLAILIVTGIGVIINITCYLISKKTANVSLFAAIICLILFLCTAFASVTSTEYLKATIEIDSKPKSIKIADIRIECSGCGNKLWASENKYCSECGNEILNNNNNFTSAIYYCPFCKELTSTSKNYCEHCGHNMMEINSQLKRKDVNIKKR